MFAQNGKGLMVAGENCTYNLSKHTARPNMDDQQLHNFEQKTILSGRGVRSHSCSAPWRQEVARMKHEVASGDCGEN